MGSNYWPQDHGSRWNGDIHKPRAGLAHELIHGHKELYDKKAKEERKSPDSMPKSQREIWTDGEEKSVIEEVNEYNDDWAPHEGDRKSHRPANVERVRQRDPTAGPPPPKPDPKPAEKQEAPKPEDDDTSDSDK